MSVDHRINNNYNVSIQIGYDGLGRRTAVKNALNQTWTNTYADVNGGEQVSTNFPGVNAEGAYGVIRTRDRLGRTVGIIYGNPPDAVGNSHI